MEGYVRMPAEADSMTAFLRGYALEPHGSKVKYHTGKTKHAKTAVAVFAMHLGEKNLQQCADSVMRMYAEYMRSCGREDEIAYHFVSGFLCDWPTFLKAGSPGHVVMVVDVCEKDGKKAFLLAQGFMPAQQFHVLCNNAHLSDPWYYVDEIKYPFKTPEYTFSEGSFRRPVYLKKKQ